jgi:hypothetical protein
MLVDRRWIRILSVNKLLFSGAVAGEQASLHRLVLHLTLLYISLSFIFYYLTPIT